MNSIFFFYTLAILVVCLATAAFSISAWASTRRRIYVWLFGAFACYAVETIEIFFYEHLRQNEPFPIGEYYQINYPIIRTLVAAALLLFLWFALLDTLDKHSKKLALAPGIAFVVADAVILLALPEGSWRQWAYYTTRQLFLVYIGAYCIYCYHTSSDERYRTRLYKLHVPLIICAMLVLCIFIEDIYIILVQPPTEQPSWLLLYLSERNISENILMCFISALVIREAYRTLSIRIKEAPTGEEVADLERHIAEALPAYRDAFKLSKRETEVLELVLQGKSTQEIADELYLAVGTVKTHVHNILTKTGTGNRKELALHFWRH